MALIDSKLLIVVAPLSLTKYPGTPCPVANAGWIWASVVAEALTLGLTGLSGWLPLFTDSQSLSQPFASDGNHLSETLHSTD